MNTTPVRTSSAPSNMSVMLASAARVQDTGMYAYHGSGTAKAEPKPYFGVGPTEGLFYSPQTKAFFLCPRAGREGFLLGVLLGLPRIDNGTASQGGAEPLRLSGVVSVKLFL
jgi:hypothetical protein